MGFGFRAWHLSREKTMLRWSDEQLAAYQAIRKAVANNAPIEPPARAKYRNKKTTINGKTFDSKLEASRYVQLVRLQEGGVISNLKCQVRFALEINNNLICHYIADFTYRDAEFNEVVEDAKGVRTKDYVLKKKLMRAIHGIDIQEYRREKRAARLK